MCSRASALLVLVACTSSPTTDEVDPSGGGGKTDDTEGGIARNWRVGGFPGTWAGWGRDRTTVVGIRGDQELVWDVVSGHLLERRTVGDARCNATSPTGYRVTCRADGIDIEDVMSPNGVHVALHAVDAAYFDGDRIAAAGRGRGGAGSALSIIDRTTRTRLQTIDMNDQIEHVELLPGDRVLVRLLYRSEIYRISDGVLVSTLGAASASPDRTLIAAIDGVYDITTLARRSQFVTPLDSGVGTVAWAADSQTFALVPLGAPTTDQDNAFVYSRAGTFVRKEYRPAGVQLEGTAQDGSTLTVDSHAIWLSPRRSLSLGAAGVRIAGGADHMVAAEPTGLVTLYDADGTLQASYRPLGASLVTRRIAWVALDPSGVRLAMGVTEGPSSCPGIRLFDVTSGALTNRTELSHCDRTAVVWSPDGMRFAVRGSQEVRIFDRTGTFQRQIATSEHPRSVAWRPDGQALAASLDDYHLLGLDVRNGGLLFDLATDRTFAELSFSPDGAWVAGRVQNDQEVGVVRVDGSASVTLSDSSAATWSPTGNQLAVTSVDGKLAIWDLATRTNVGSRVVSSEPCPTVLWPEEDSIIVGCADSTVASFRADP